MDRRLAAVFGNIAKHILGGLRHALRAIALTFIIVLIVVAVATEVIAGFLTHSFPSGLTHLTAAALGLAFAYAAAVTVAMEELLRAIIKAIEMIIEEAEKLEKKAAEEIEILARKAEDEAVKLGRVAVTDAGALGRTAIGDVGTLGRTIGGVAGGLAGGIERDARAVGTHLPGVHHNNATQSPTASGTAATLPSGDSTQQQ